MDFSKKYDRPSPEVTANPISRLLYCWLFPLFKYGYSNDLEVKDLYNATKGDFSQHLGDTLEKYWIQELRRSREENQKPSLLRAIRLTFMKSYAFYGIELFFQGVVIRLTQPLVLALLIKHFEHTRKSPAEEGWLLATGVILMTFVGVLIMHHASLGQVRIGMQCRVATCSLIYRKLLRLNKSSVAKSAAGQVVNLLSNDVSRFDIVPLFLHYIWIMPILTIVASVIMYNSIGYAAFAGIIAITIQAVPLQGYLSRLLGKLRFKIAHRTDRRVQQMSEITSGIRVIKMYAWEAPFEKIVALARKLEIDVITIASYIRGFVVALSVFTERFTLFLTVITYVFLGNHLTGDKIFSMAQFFNTIQLYMAIFYPLAIAYFAEARTSVKRIEEFLMQDEAIMPIESNMEPAPQKRGTIKLTNVKASWLPNPIIDTLSNMNLNIQVGTLYAVVGPVGAGKSSFLQLLLKELPINLGKLEIMGNISYASQEPWLFVSSVRSNILFGLPYLKSKYKAVVNVCALERDFELLPYGDATLVGERGSSLSGGQRARINLARAVYRQADIYLLDDPLSAVDAHVSKHLFDECIVRYLRDKTRILVTHQLQFLKYVDQIIIINNGQIEKIGTYAELADKELSHLKLESPSEETVEKDIEDSKRSTRLMSLSSHKSVSTEGADDENEPTETHELMEKGAISSSLYWTYFRQGGGICFLLFFIAMLIIAQAACNASDIWVTHWTNVEEACYSAMLNNSPIVYLNGGDDFLTQNSTVPINDMGNSTLNMQNDTLEALMLVSNLSVPLQNSTTVPYYVEQQNYIYVYTVLIIFAILLTSIRSFIFYKVCMNASKGLHNTMFHNVLKATMRFFDTNPSGRILNRFSKDMGAVDELLPRALLDAIQIFLVMSGILVMVFIVTPWMIAPTIVLATLFYLVRKVFLATAQDIKRLEGITKAPVFSHVSASLDGITTIRAAHAQVMITKEFDVLQDQHTSAWFLLMATSEAFGFYLDIISILFLIILTYQFLIFDDGTTLSGNVGLVISQSLILTGMLQYGVRQTAEVANQMTSVERIMQYTRLDKEGPFETSPTKKPHRDWPEFGRILFKNLSLQYVADDPPVLNNLNIEIDAGSKVGIVGRTGAGKSSLIAALFRLAPLDGSIIIDNIDSKEIGLHDLRTKISIIPQEPVLFTASVRYNLDPLEKSGDEELWKALEDVELKENIAHLNQEVSEGGSNFSAGQRQLVCLARAILKNNKILVMDEATANVDNQTDQLIQATIRRNFKDCTVLTIAHRLNTIMDSDKVLVMDAGEAVEYGIPFELLKNENGYFSKMLKETGPAMESKLRAIAQEAYNNRNKHVIVENGHAIVNNSNGTDESN